MEAEVDMLGIGYWHNRAGTFVVFNKYMFSLST